MNSRATEAAELLEGALGHAAVGEGLLLAGELRETLEPALGPRVRRIEVLEGETPPERVPVDRRYALGVVAGQLERLERRAATELLARLRDQVCARVLLLVSPDAGWSRADLLALGYTRIRRGSGPARWALYEYEITTYNPERTWNNPSDWANPENFDKYRW